jgi:hypothetical protein
VTTLPGNAILKPEITAECSSICAIKNGKLASIFIDSGIRQIRLAYCDNLPKIYQHQFTTSCRFLSVIGLFLLGLAENSSLD